MEQEYALAPLGLPADATADEDDLRAAPAVSLFVDRAQSVREGFELDSGNRAAVVEICRRLDGLPLALELAAARLRILTPQALLERLNHALDVLTTGARDQPARQQTLRATIDWSHSLLDEREQRLFRRMAVFVGGATLSDIEAVCCDPGDDVLDDLESLLDKALVQPKGDRFQMLQVLAEYADERLTASRSAPRSRAGTPTGSRRSLATSKPGSKATTSCGRCGAGSPTRATCSQLSTTTCRGRARARRTRARRACA